MATRGNKDERKRHRQEGALARAQIRASLTDAEQLDRLILRGHGDCKEALRLEAKIRSTLAELQEKEL